MSSSAWAQRREFRVSTKGLMAKTTIILSDVFCWEHFLCPLCFIVRLHNFYPRKKRFFPCIFRPYEVFCVVHKPTKGSSQKNEISFSATDKHIIYFFIDLWSSFKSRNEFWLWKLHPPALSPSRSSSRCYTQVINDLLDLRSLKLFFSFWHFHAW